MYANYVCINLLIKERRQGTHSWYREVQVRRPGTLQQYRRTGQTEVRDPVRNNEAVGTSGHTVLVCQQWGRMKEPRSTAASHGASWGDWAAAYSTQKPTDASALRSRINQMRRIPQQVQVHDCYSPGN